MEKLNSLLYSILLLSVITTSANAKYKMFSSSDGTFLYEDSKGIVLKLIKDSKRRDYFKIVPLKADKFHTTGEELFKNTTPKNTFKP